MNIKKLDQTINTKDFTYERIQENESGYIYRQSDRDTEMVIAYEVWRKVIKSKQSWKTAIGKKITQEAYDLMPDLKETAPRDEAFGKTAWTFPNLSLAQAALRNLKPTKAKIKF